MAEISYAGAQKRADVILFTCLTVISGLHLAAARALLDWSQEDLARESGVAIGTIRRMEAAKNDPVISNTVTLAKVMECLQKAGMEFLNNNEPGVRLRAKPLPKDSDRLKPTT